TAERPTPTTSTAPAPSTTCRTFTRTGGRSGEGQTADSKRSDPTARPSTRPLDGGRSTSAERENGATPRATPHRRPTMRPELELVGRSAVHQEREDHRVEREDQRHDHRDPVEVLLHHGRTRRRGAQPTTEHVGQAAALPAVDQHEEDH